MFIPVGMKYTSRVSTVVKRKELCPRCGCSYSYQCKVKASARTGSFLFLNNAGARARASDLAKDRLARKIAKAKAPVPCPQCLYLAPSVVFWKAIKLLPYLLGGGFMLLMGFAMTQPSHYDTPRPADQPLGLVCMLLGATLILLPAAFYLYRVGLSVPAFRKAAAARYGVKVLAAGYQPGYPGVDAGTNTFADTATASDSSSGWDDDGSIPFADSPAASHPELDEPAPELAPKPAPARNPTSTKPATPKTAVTAKVPSAGTIPTSSAAAAKPAATKTASNSVSPKSSPPAAGSSIVVACGNCGKSFRVNSKFAGKKAKCTGCSAEITIPAS